MSITDRITNAVRWRTLAGRHRRALLTGGLALTTLAASAIASPPAASLGLFSWTSTEAFYAYVGNTYNYRINVNIDGDAPILVTASRAIDPSPGLVDREPLVGWACGYAPYEVAPGDDLRRATNQLLWLGREHPISAADGRCSYINVRVVATRKGVLRLRGFEVDYRVGSHTWTARLDYDVTLNVTRDGIDDRTPALWPAIT